MGIPCLSKVSFADGHTMPSVEEEGRVIPAPLAWQEADIKNLVVCQEKARGNLKRWHGNWQ